MNSSMAADFGMSCGDINRVTPNTLDNLSVCSTSPADSGRASPEAKSVCGTSSCDEGYCDISWTEKLRQDTVNTFNSQCPVDAWECENLHLLWQSHFHRTFGSFSHTWRLLATFDEPNLEFERFQPLRIHEDIAKVRFYCPDCLRAWTSMRGKIVFWYGLDYQTGEGIVLFKLFGQQCKDCYSGYFEPAMWYPEEVKKVINNVSENVRCFFYGYQMFGPPQISSERRHGKPKGYHNRNLCHACQIGMCRSGRR